MTVVAWFGVFPNEPYDVVICISIEGTADSGSSAGDADISTEEKKYKVPPTYGIGYPSGSDAYDVGTSCNFDKIRKFPEAGNAAMAELGTHTLFYHEFVEG